MKIKKNILFIAPFYRGRSPSQRYRIEQFLKLLEDEGYEYDISHLITKENDNLFYSKGKYVKKFFLLIQFYFKRLKDIRKASGYDYIFVQREAYYLGTTYFEKKFAKKSTLIYDFDDSIWLKNVSDVNKRFDWLKNYSKVKKIISFADIVIVGNKYLYEFAKKYNSNIKIIPTVVDTEEYKKLGLIKDKKKITIGWSGSITTIQHFEYAINSLYRIKEKYKDNVDIKVIGDSNYRLKKLGIIGFAWSKENELEDLLSIDIGIMPLPDNEWTKGKCGCKGLLYMSLKIPTIMSPVGVNKEIIQDGINGFLATDEEEWIEKISLLIENKELRQKIGNAGRQTVVEKYSVESQKETFLNVFRDLSDI